MSGITPLIDSLLATRLAQRTDLVPLKAQVDIDAPTAANPLEPVVNDVRLASRTTLQPHAIVGTASLVPNAPAAAIVDAPVSLSLLAQTLTELLDKTEPGPTRLLGNQALWPGPTAPDIPQLAATLASTVADSGLFYESHLQQFATGRRALAQLRQEPQAQVTQQPARHPTTPDLVDRVAVHPDTQALVRQQLDLLALPIVRWSGEAWPGIRLDWDIQEEPDTSPEHPADDAPAQRWTTRLALQLPKLGPVEAQLHLDGNTLRLRLRAESPTTAALLDPAGTALPERLSAQGLQLLACRIETQND